MIQNDITLIIEISTTVPINIYPIISEDIVNLKTAAKNPIHTINMIAILRQIESLFLKLVIAISSVTSLLYFDIRIDKDTKMKKASIPTVFWIVS